MKFVKVNNFWWELDGKKIYNMAGGHQYIDYYEENDLIQDKAEAKDWEDLDWIGTRVYNNTFKTGWIDRDGKFYGCERESHGTQARFIHRKTQKELDNMGWVKIYTSDWFPSGYENGLNATIVKYKLNELQKNALSKLDFTDEEIEYI